MRPASDIRFDLSLAFAYRDRYRDRPVIDRWVQLMRDDNERDIIKLQAELAEAMSGDLEVSLSGTPVQDHTVTVPYISRVLDALQASFRTIAKSLSPEPTRRSETTLSISGTAPGSFKVALKTPTIQLDLIEEPLIDRAMAVIVDLLAEAANGTIASAGPSWAATADEPAVRAMIRLSSALAGSRGATHLRWRPISGPERIVSLSADAARSLAVALAGESGREIVTVVGHLTMAKDRPPRAQIRTRDDDYFAEPKTEEMLDRVKELLFEEVRATIVIDMRTSLSTGSPDVDIELLDLEPAEPPPQETQSNSEWPAGPPRERGNDRLG